MSQQQKAEVGTLWGHQDWLLSSMTFWAKATRFWRSNLITSLGCAPITFSREVAWVRPKLSETIAGRYQSLMPISWLWVIDYGTQMTFSSNIRKPTKSSSFMLWPRALTIAKEELQKIWWTLHSRWAELKKMAEKNNVGIFSACTKLRVPMCHCDGNESSQPTNFRQFGLSSFTIHWLEELCGRL